MGAGRRIDKPVARLTKKPRELLKSLESEIDSEFAEKRDYKEYHSLDQCSSVGSSGTQNGTGFNLFLSLSSLQNKKKENTI